MTSRTRTAILVLLLLAIAAAAQFRDRQTWAERDQWQRAQDVLDALHIKTGSQVADVGAGEGYFTVKLAERVGATGKVYAVDIDPATVANLRKLAAARRLAQVQAVQDTERDPRLAPRSLDAVLVVHAYHDFTQPAPMLNGLFNALHPGGMIGIVDRDAELESGAPRDQYTARHQLPESFVRQELQRAGFTGVREAFRIEPTGNRAGEHWYMVTADKPR